MRIGTCGASKERSGSIWTRALSASAAAQPQQINVVADAGLTAQLAEKDAEIMRLREEMERLKHSMAQGGASRPTSDFDWDAEEDAVGKPASDIDWSAEEDAVGKPTSDINWDAEEGAGDESSLDIDWGIEDDDAPSIEIDWSADEGDADEAEEETEWAEDADGAESSEAFTEDVEDVFDLSAFLTRSVEHAQSLTFVDRMRREGQETAEITIEELIEYLDKKQKQAREIA